MSRMIDAEHFKRFLQALCKAGAPYDEVIQLLDKEPTAYDVEKVVEQLEDLEEDFCQCFRKCEEQCFIQRVTDIVRKGGVE